MLTTQKPVPHLPVKKILIYILLLLICFTIVYIEGIIPDVLVKYYLSIGFVIAVLIPVSGFYLRSMINLVILVVVSCLTMTVLDIIARPLTKEILYYRPHERFINRMPEMPILSRYKPEVIYNGETFGDLAAMSDNPQLRVKRQVTFETDRYGFRNSKRVLEKPIDIILLGDSFGFGSGTTQQKIWSQLFTEQYDLNCYSLSLPGSPWHELMNLKIEKPRLQTHPETVVLWAIFTGNDLDGYYNENLDIPKFRKGIKRWLASLNSYRRRSPIKTIAGRLVFRKSSFALEKNLDDDRKILFYKSYLKRAQRSHEEIIQHPNYDKFRAVFQEMVDYTAVEDLNLKVVLIPSKSEVYHWLFDEEEWMPAMTIPSGFSAALEQLCKADSISYLDLKPPFIQEAGRLYQETGELLWWLDDTHWNEAGHRTAAMLVNKFLLEQ